MARSERLEVVAAGLGSAGFAQWAIAQGLSLETALAVIRNVF